MMVTTILIANGTKEKSIEKATPTMLVLHGTGKWINNRRGKDPRVIQNKDIVTTGTGQSLKTIHEEPRATLYCHKQLYFGVHIQD